MERKIVSGIMLTLFLLISMLTLAFNIQPVKASGTIYIRADGSIDPPTAPISTADNITYILTDDISSDADGIVIERNNIVVDGSRFTLHGTGSEAGIYLQSIQNVTIRDVEIQNFQEGIAGTVSDSNLEIFGSNIVNNSGPGISVSGEYYIILSLVGSNITGNHGIGVCVAHSFSDTVTIVGTNIANNDGDGVFAGSMSGDAHISESNIRNNNGSGINFWEHGGSISRNNITNNGGDGIYLCSGYPFDICENNITNNGDDGISCFLPGPGFIDGNNIASNGYDGIRIESASGEETFSRNNIANNGQSGIQLIETYSAQTVCGNNIFGNMYGIRLSQASENRFYHNNLIDNTIQVYVETLGVTNLWDDGYPSGGNYWSNYNGTDLYNGSNQKETGSDGIGDTPYIIDVNNTDNYPLMLPYKGHNIAVTNAQIYKTVAAQGTIQKVDVEVANVGSFPQTFSLTVYANDTETQTLAVLLAAGNSTTLTFTWNTTGFAKGNYTISAVADTVPGEIDTDDNTYTDGIVYVGILGDVNGDGIIELKDFFELSKAFGSKPGDPNWNPNADVATWPDGDNIIELKDFFVLSQHFGEHDP